MPQEDSLIGKAKTGDLDALNELVSTYWHPIYRYVTYKTGSPDDAQELTQETFYRAFRSLQGFRQSDASFKTYLSHIAFNLIKDFWRRKGRIPAFINIADYHEPAATDDQPDMQAINMERREAIAVLLKELPCDQRQVVELRIIAGLPIRDTALALGKSEAAVKMLQQRGLKSLRMLLINNGIVDNEADWS